jgi:diguanylate cyclase (GGDEF)-like protein
MRLATQELALRRRLAARQTLDAVVAAVAATADPADIGVRTLEHAATWLPAKAWSIWSADLSGQVVLLATRGPAEDDGAAAKAIAQHVLQIGADFASADLSRDRRLSTPGSGSALAFLLSCREQNVGVLVATDPIASARVPRLSGALQSGLRGVLQAVAGSLDKALLLAKAEALSVTDDLTLLYNSRYLNQVLRRETKRAVRNGRPLSVLFIDLDGFKSINDTYGHLSGSRALVEAGGVIRGSARETDIAARFGGDEFALILPDTGAPGALAVAERVRERIAAHPFLAGDGLSLSLTASVGVATLPDAADSADELVEAADAAMYHVKDRGKNGTYAAPRRSLQS